MAFRVVHSSLAHHLTARSSASSLPSTDFDDPEEESIRLAIALQLEDLENARPDEEEAVFDVYRSYLEEEERFLADRRLAEELAAGEDPSLLELMEDVLEVAAINHRMGAEEVEEIHVDDVDDNVDGEDGDGENDELMKLACELSLKMFEQEKRRNEVCSSVQTNIECLVSVLHPSPTYL